MKAIHILLELIKGMDTGVMEASLCSADINVCLCSDGLIRYAMTIGSVKDKGQDGTVEVRGGVPGYLDPTVLELGDPDLAEKLATIFAPGTEYKGNAKECTPWGRPYRAIDVEVQGGRK